MLEDGEGAAFLAIAFLFFIDRYQRIEEGVPHAVQLRPTTP